MQDIFRNKGRVKQEEKKGEKGERGIVYVHIWTSQLKGGLNKYGQFSFNLIYSLFGVYF